MPSKVAIVSGGTSGIGLAVAKHLAQIGVHVVITGRREQEGQLSACEVQAAAAAGSRVQYQRNDVSNEEDVATLFCKVATEYGAIDYLVNSAGLGLETKLLADSSSDRFREMLAVNVLGSYFCMKYALKHMLLRGKGGIVNVASAAGLNGMPSVGPYAATKHAVVGLTKTAALEYATQGIRINAVAPGSILTERLSARIVESNLDEKTIGAMHPMQRLGTPDEVARAVCWLLSEEASFVTGHILSVDSGLQAK
jgi:NAD(P)-dependent dehydrogenase (short-subunit alcohol dehydrogenase family)